ncbi:MAG: C45 family peptidase [Ardenticatenales bacterium]
MLPILAVTGGAYDQGLTHGRALRDAIDHNLDVYFRRFRDEGQMSRARVLERAGHLWERLADETPEYAAGVRGIAAGAGQDVLAVAALNARYELLYAQFTLMALHAESAVDGCTSFALMPAATADGHTLLGQNWDWIPDVKGAVIVERQPDGFGRAAFTEAGVFGGKIGLNSHGLGLAINGLTSQDDDWSRPADLFHVRCWQILGERDVDAAVARITRGPRACSGNFVIAQAGRGAVDVEASPMTTCRIAPDAGGRLVHSNHFFDPEGAGIAETPNVKRFASVNRLTCLQASLAARERVSVDDVQTLLRDHTGYPYSVCRHPDPADASGGDYRTVTSVIMDLDAHAMWVTDGPPCEAPYQRVRLGEEAIGDRAAEERASTGS